MRTDPVYLHLKRRLRDARDALTAADRKHRSYWEGVEKALTEALIFIEQQPRSES